MAQTRPSPTLSRGFTRLGRFLAPYAADAQGRADREAAENDTGLRWNRRLRRHASARTTLFLGSPVLNCARTPISAFPGNYFAMTLLRVLP